MDLTVAVTPLYFGTMAAERSALIWRAHRRGPSAADYTRADTTASLTMGVLSLVVPLACQRVVKTLVPGRGRRFANGVLALTAAGAVATSIADRLAAPRVPANTKSPAVAPLGVDVESPIPVPVRARRARAFARVASVATVASAGVLGAAATATWGTASRQWRRGKRHDLGAGWLGWAGAMVGWDFIYYWNHRLMHEIRAQWAIHVVHHSSEHYNLSTALRQPVSPFGVWIPYGVLARFGIRPSLIEQSRALNLIYQYWIHTDLIRTLGPAEEVLNTPSHHRVHHGSNRRYLDRNHGGILISWDRVFGTFERERTDEPVVYGLTRNIGTYEPWKVVTHEYADMFRDVARSTNWSDRLGFVLASPGWASRRRDEQVALEQVRTHLAATAVA